MIKLVCLVLILLLSTSLFAEEIVRKVIYSKDDRTEIFYIGDREIARKEFKKYKLVKETGTIPDGIVESTLKHGKAKLEQEYKDGKIVGSVRRYYKDGVLTTKQIFKNGKIVESIMYDKKGNPTDSETYHIEQSGKEVSDFDKKRPLKLNDFDNLISGSFHYEKALLTFGKTDIKFKDEEKKRFYYGYRLGDRTEVLMWDNMGLAGLEHRDKNGNILETRRYASGGIKEVSDNYIVLCVSYTSGMWDPVDEKYSIDPEITEVKEEFSGMVSDFPKLSVKDLQKGQMADIEYIMKGEEPFARIIILNDHYRQNLNYPCGRNTF